MARSRQRRPMVCDDGCQPLEAGKQRVETLGYEGWRPEPLGAADLVPPRECYQGSVGIVFGAL